MNKRRRHSLTVPTKRRAGSAGTNRTLTHTGPRREAASPKTTGGLGLVQTARGLRVQMGTFLR